MKLRDSISKKLTAMNLLVSGGALILAALGFFAYDLYTFRLNFIANRYVEAEIIGSNLASPLVFNDEKAAESILSALHASHRIEYAAVYTNSGQFFSGYWRPPAPRRPLALPPVALDFNAHHWIDNRREFVMVEPVMLQGKPVGIIYIRSDLEALWLRLRSYGFLLLVIIAAALVATLLLSAIAQRSITKPILALAAAARRVSREKDYEIRVPVSREHDEVAVLNNSFNEMLLEIQKRDTALRESEQQFRGLADSIPQLAWMAEPNGNVFWYNRRFYEYTGATPEQLVGWGWQSVHDPNKLPAVLEKWRASLATGVPFQMIFPLRGADGQFRDFLTLAVPVRDTRNQIVRWFGSNTDMTEQRRSEEALRQTEKLAATGRLAASIAHEINNPLEAVTNLVYLARKQPENASRYLQLADQELDRIAQITKNTLGFYRDTASARHMDVADVLVEVLALYSRKLLFKRITVIPEYEKGISITAFPGEIRQIFANLIANAIEALPENGILTLRTAKAYSQDAAHRPGVRVTFLDNGSGISATHRKKIFEPFYTTKKDVGTGLGLWLTSQLVEKHHGTLQVRSSTNPANSWTVFSVFLPAEPAGPTIEPPVPGETRPT